MRRQSITHHRYPAIQPRRYTTVDSLCTWIRITRITRTDITRTAITVRRHHLRDSNIVRNIMLETVDMEGAFIREAAFSRRTESLRQSAASSRRIENLRLAERRHAGGPLQLGGAEDRRNRHNGF